MHSWGLDCDFFKGIITDAAAKINSLGREIEEQWNTKYAIHVYWTDHVLQLTAILAFSGNVAVDNYTEDASAGCLKKACGLVSHVNSSTEFRTELW